MMLALDLTILLLFALLVVGVFSLALQSRWNAWQWRSFAVVAVLTFAGYWAISDQVLSLTMIPTSAWWDHDRQADVGTEPGIVLAFGTLTLVSQYVLISNRFTKGPRGGILSDIGVQAACFILGGTIATIAYPTIISVILMPPQITLKEATEHGVLPYLQGLHSAVLTTALAFSVLGRLYSGTRKTVSSVKREGLNRA